MNRQWSMYALATASQRVQLGITYAIVLKTSNL